MYSCFDYSEVFLPFCSHGSSIVTAIVNCWSSFNVWFDVIDLKQSILMILKKVLLLDSKVCFSFFSVSVVSFIAVLTKVFAASEILLFTCMVTLVVYSCGHCGTE